MARGDTPPFLERRGYRMRRMMDAVRLLPFLGVGLFMIPLLWPDGQDPSEVGMPMSRALLYIFIVWVVLIIGSFILWFKVSRLRGEGEDGQTGPESG